MRKLICFLLSGILLTGCFKSDHSSTPKETSKPTPTPVVEKQDDKIDDVIQENLENAETIEGCVEEDLPMTLRITVQEVEILFTKDSSFQALDEVQVGDMVEVTYVGDIEQHPVALSVKKQ